MTLLTGQNTLTLSTLYEARSAVTGEIMESQLEPNIFINSGSVDIYGSNSATQPANLAAMVLTTGNTNVAGVEAFGVIPRWIAVVQNTGTTTELVASGVRVTGRGAIA